MHPSFIVSNRFRVLTTTKRQFPPVPNLFGGDEVATKQAMLQ